MEQAFDFSSVQAFDAGEARVKTHLLNGRKIAIQGAEGGPVADLTEPFGLASLPAFIRRELTTDAAQDSIAQVVARMARQYAVAVCHAARDAGEPINPWGPSPCRGNHDAPVPSGDAAQGTLAGIELMPGLKEGPRVAEEGAGGSRRPHRATPWPHSPLADTGSASPRVYARPMATDRIESLTQTEP